MRQDGRNEAWGSGPLAHRWLWFKGNFMTLLLLEALGAMLMLIFIVWWTMFSGRKKGELKDPTASPVEGAKPDSKNELEKGAEQDQN